MPDNTEIITTPERLRELLDELAGEGPLSLDIESDGFYNYAERVCIVTLSTGERNVVIDSLAVGDATRELERLTARADVPLLMHSGQNDVLALKRDYGIAFGTVRDTAAAALLLDLPQTGLAALVEGYLGLSLEKELQRYDWSRRPIERDHVHYLINDTKHLFSLHDLLYDELRAHDLLDEYEIECRTVAESEPREREFDPERFRRVKGHGNLSDAQRGILKAVYAWRDGLARELGRAPFRTVGDATLLELAKQAPADVAALRSLRGIGDWIIEEHADALLEALRVGASEPVSARPPRRPTAELPLRLTPRQRDLLGRLKRWREEERKVRGIGLQAVLPTSTLQPIVLNPPRSLDELAAVPRVGQARAERYGAKILKLLNGG